MEGAGRAEVKVARVRARRVREYFMIALAAVTGGF